MIADALERAASTDPQKVRDALSTLDVSSGYAAMGPGGKVKFWSRTARISMRIRLACSGSTAGDLAAVFPKEDARAPLMKS